MTIKQLTYQFEHCSDCKYCTRLIESHWCKRHSKSLSDISKIPPWCELETIEWEKSDFFYEKEDIDYLDQ